jgi:hypothetical protein
MRVCGQRRHFWTLTVNRTAFCSAPVLSEFVDIAVSEEKRSAPNIIAAWLAIDGWNHIINGERIAKQNHLQAI